MTANEIVVGTAQDLSGPIVNFSKAAVNGMRMRVDEINAAGGIHGRKLRLAVEDHGYDPKKAVLAAQKMVQQDNIFAALRLDRNPDRDGGDADLSRRQGRAPVPLTGHGNVRAAARR